MLRNNSPEENSICELEPSAPRNKITTLHAKKLDELYDHLYLFSLQVQDEVAFTGLMKIWSDVYQIREHSEKLNKRVLFF